MTDIWDHVVQRDPYELRLEAAIDTATTTLSPQFAFVTEASTKASFDDRLSIVSAKVEQVIGAATIGDEALFALTHEAVLSQWEQDFNAIVAARASESQRTGNRRGFFRKEKRARKITTEGHTYHGDGEDKSAPMYAPGVSGGERRAYYDWQGDQAAKGVANDQIMGFDDWVLNHWNWEGHEAALTVNGHKRGKIAMTAAEASNLINRFPEEVQARVAAMQDLLIYGPNYSRGVTENLYDALHFAAFATGGDDMEYFLRKAEAQATYARTGEWERPMHPRSTPEQQSMLGRKQAYNDEFWAVQNAHADEPHTYLQDTTFSRYHQDEPGPCGICGQPLDYALHTRTTYEPTGAAAVASKTADRDRATSPQLGDRTSCKYCGQDIEYWDDHGWIDRGNNRSCSMAIAAKSGDVHEPVSDRNPNKWGSIKPMAFEASLSAIKTTNDPAVLGRMLNVIAKSREAGVDAITEASLETQSEMIKIRLAQLGVTVAAANDDLVDWETYIDAIDKERNHNEIDGSQAFEPQPQDYADWARQGVLTHSFGHTALTIVREGSQIHWAVTDDAGDDEKDSGSAPTVRDALEQAYDVLHKVLDKDPPPSDEIVQEVNDAVDATSDAVEDAGGDAPADPTADADGKPISDTDKAPVDPHAKQPADGAPVDGAGDADKKDLEAKPNAPVDDKKVDPSDVKVDPDAKAADDPDAKPVADADPKPGDAPPDPDAKPGDAPPADGDKPAANDAPAQADGDTPAHPDDVVDTAEDKSMGDVLGLEPSTMDTGQTATMTYTLSDGTVGDTNVTFLREDNGIFFFDGPNGEFGLGDRDGEWVDADGNSFAFSNGDAVEEITGEDDPSNGAELEDIDLDVPVEDDKEDAPADGDKAPAKDDSKDDDDDKGKPPWAKSKKSMLQENPWMTDAMATRLARQAHKLARSLMPKTAGGELTPDMQADINAIGEILGSDFTQSDWYDAWGAAMGWAFSLNDWLADNGGQTNSTFRQSAGGSDTDAYEYEMIDSMGLSVDQVEKAEQMLDGLLDKLKAAGRDY